MNARPLLLAVFLSCFISSAPAAVILGNYHETLRTAFGEIGHPIMNPTIDRLNALKFTMPDQDYILDEILLNLRDPDPSDSMPLLTIRNNDAGGTDPGSLFSSFTGPTPTFGDVPLQADRTFLPTVPTILEANTTYWMKLENVGAGSFGWYLVENFLTPTGDATYDNWRTSNDGGANYLNLGSRYRFEISGTAIPEPSRGLLLTAGFVGTLLYRRRGSLSRSR